MPRVLNKHKDVIPPDAVYIGRPTKWGNPFSMFPKPPFMDQTERSREVVIRKFEEWVRTQPDLVEAAKKELRGRDLVCFCAPLVCHGDTWLRIANEE